MRSIAQVKPPPGASALMAPVPGLVCVALFVIARIREKVAERIPILREPAKGLGGLEFLFQCRGARRRDVDGPTGVVLAASRRSVDCQDRRERHAGPQLGPNDRGL